VHYTLIIEDRNGIIADEINFEQGSFTIGRLEGNDIELSSNSVSRHHARIYTQGEQAFVVDMNSSNGVFVDGERIYAATPLTSGSQIRVGDFLILLKARGQAPPQAAPAQPYIDQSVDTRYPRLVRVGDIMEGETFSLSAKESLVGRTEDNAVVISDPSISRHHAKIVTERGRWVLIDQGSSNGTRINDHVVYEPVLLAHGDLIRFGNIRMVFGGPGRGLDLAEYSRLISGSNRGLVIAVTVLSLLLVLVASGIGAFVLLDTSNGGSNLTTGTDASMPRDLARERKSEGDLLAGANRWQDAMDKYRVALDLDPEYVEAQAALVHVEAEFNASRIMQEVDIYIDSGNQLEQSENFVEGLQVYERARHRLNEVPPASTYFSRAQDRVTVLIDPGLMRIHRHLGAQSEADGNFAGAVGHYQQALSIWQSLPADRRAVIEADIRGNLWRNLVAAGDSAYDENQYEAAVTFYERALQLASDLPSASERRLRRARRQVR
jgi:pSer/pThr/pTyr-binding forkhead associated (FHA) protein/tetratricopeptide (TPR) repeat protein